MDLKNDGLTMEIIKNALEITYDARVQILDQIMLPCISEPRAEVSQYAPKMITMHIDPDKIREVIGKGGTVIQKIVADTGAKVDIDDDGTIHIASPDAACCDAAKKMIDDIVFVPEVGQAVLRQRRAPDALRRVRGDWPPARTAWSTSPSWPTTASRRSRTWSTSAT